MYWLRGLALRRATPIARNPRTASRFKGHFHTPRNLHHIKETKESIKESEGMGASVLFLEKNSWKSELKPTANVFATTEKNQR